MEQDSALTFNFRNGTFPIEDTNEENLVRTRRHRPRLVRRPPALCSGSRWMCELPRESDCDSCSCRLRRCIFRFGTCSHQGSSQLFQVTSHWDLPPYTPLVCCLDQDLYVNF